MNLEGKLKAIIKITYREDTDKCVSREESTQLFYKKSFHGVSKYMGDLSGQDAGGTRKGLRMSSVSGITEWARMLCLGKR